VKHFIDALWDDKPVDVTTETNAIWDIANVLRGRYQSDQYRDVIIPFTIIRRLECALRVTKEKVVAYAAVNPDAPESVLCDKAGLRFYNKSRFTLRELLNDADNIQANFFDEEQGGGYILGFSKNVQEILKLLRFRDVVEGLVKSERLYNVIKRFSEIDLDPRHIDNMKMGYVFEDLIRRFSENKKAGEHYTGRDLTKLLVALLLTVDADDLFEKGVPVPLLDQGCGTGGMLSTGFNYIHHFNPSAKIFLFGQEVNPESYAICLAEMLIKGQDASHIALADTMKEDRFPKQKMRLVVENPPFGEKWGGKDLKELDKIVRDEHAKGFAGRWGAGLPGTNDMQLLFVQSAVDKLDPKHGRAAIIEDGSPLFAGSSASSGESQIRKWLLDEDLLEAVIALPEDLFYNTNIGTYVWIIAANKTPERRGKVQFIDARKMAKPLKKSLGKKRNEITPEYRAQIVKLYADFKPAEIDGTCVSKIFDCDDFKYREYTVIPPRQRNYALREDRITALKRGGGDYLQITAIWRNLRTSRRRGPSGLTRRIASSTSPIARTKRPTVN